MSPDQPVYPVNIEKLLSTTEPLRAKGQYIEALHTIDTTIHQSVPDFVGNSLSINPQCKFNLSKLARMDTDSSMGAFRNAATWEEGKQYLKRARDNLNNAYPLLDNQSTEPKIPYQQRIEQLRDRAKYLLILASVSGNTTVYLQQALFALREAVFIAETDDTTEPLKGSSALGTVLVEQYIVQKRFGSSRFIENLKRGYRYVKESKEAGADRRRKLSVEVMKIAFSERRAILAIRAMKDYLASQWLFNREMGMQPLHGVVSYLRRGRQRQKTEDAMRKSFSQSGERIEEYNLNDLFQ